MKGPDGRSSALVRSLQVWVERELQAARGLVVVPVLLLAVSAAAAFVSVTVLLIAALGQLVRHALPAGSRSGLFLVLEAFLIGAGLILDGAGFYQLFVTRSWVGVCAGTSRAGWRSAIWLTSGALMISVLVLVLVLVAVGGFVSAAAGLRSGHDILFLGAAAALVVAALAVFLRFRSDR